MGRDLVPMFEDRSYRSGLGDEDDDLHLAAASVTGQRVDFVDAVDAPGGDGVEVRGIGEY